LRKEAKVYFAPARSKTNRGLADRFAGMLDSVGPDLVKKGDLVAIKTTFGEEGCTSFVRPLYFRRVVDWVKRGAGKPFLTDSCTLYHGRRSNGVDHLNLAVEHGFSYASIGAPLVIADGIRSRDYVEVRVDLEHFKTVKLGSAAYYADSLVSVAHFKGHLATGFGGTFKNLGMGLGSRSAKQTMHGVVKPEFRDAGLCTGCGDCVNACATGAVRVASGKASFDYSKCSGCAECIAVCTRRALKILWNESSRNLCEKMVETAYGVLKGKRDRAVFFNFVIDVTPDCDCLAWSDNPIVQDVGILGSTDPVAVEQASLDMVNAQPSLPDSEIPQIVGPGVDKFRAIRPDIDGSVQMEYAEELGMGSRKYELVNLDERPPK
jgi:hypothetical protein